MGRVANRPLLSFASPRRRRIMGAAESMEVPVVEVTVQKTSKDIDATKKEAPQATPVVTGAGSGIGQATSLLAASYGANVLCVDLTDGANTTAAQIVQAGGSALAHRANVAEESEVEGYIDACINAYGSIDGIYANAGVSGGGTSVTELTVEDWQRTLGVNTVGVFLAVKHSLKHFLPQGHGAARGWHRGLGRFNGIGLRHARSP